MNEIICTSIIGYSWGSESLFHMFELLQLVSLLLLFNLKYFSKIKWNMWRFYVKQYYMSNKLKCIFWIATSPWGDTIFREPHIKFKGGVLWNCCLPLHLLTQWHVIIETLSKDLILTRNFACLNADLQSDRNDLIYNIRVGICSVLISVYVLSFELMFEGQWARQTSGTNNGTNFWK